MTAESREIVLPNLGFGMEEGKLVAWLKQPGDMVRKGEPIAEVESDKTNVELEATADGILSEIVVPAGAIAQVGGVLARLTASGSMPGVPTSEPSVARVEPEAPRSGRASPVAQRMAKEHGIDVAALSGSGPGGRVTSGDVRARLPSAAQNGHHKVQAAPAVRKYARDRGVNIQQIAGTGPFGRVTRDDVDAMAGSVSVTAARLAPEAAGDWVDVPMSSMRQRIARRLVESVQTAPQFYTVTELDLTDALAALPGGVGINALIQVLAVRALLAMPEMNATYDGEQLRQWKRVNLAVAVALPDGLITPVLRGAEEFSLIGMAARTRDLVGRAREGKLRPDEMQDGTFTVSNLGVIEHIDRFTAILNPPQVGILAVGAARDRAVVRNGGLHVRRTAFATLTADHRVIDGMRAARFMEALQTELAHFAG